LAQHWQGSILDTEIRKLLHRRKLLRIAPLKSREMTEQLASSTNHSARNFPKENKKQVTGGIASDCDFAYLD
jgi:hypothetical protein